jgi:hypothetical protein
MKTRTILFALLVASTAPLALFGTGCGGGMRPEKALTELHNPNPTVRQHAADSLRGPKVSPQQAVPALLEAVKTEQDLKAKAAMVISLGDSGTPEAKAVVDDYVAKASSHDEQKYAGRALKYWMQKTGQLPKDYKFPDGWPYGTPGYGPIIPASK